MKIFAVSADKAWFKIGEDPTKSEWYSTVKITDIREGFKSGDGVEIKSSKGQDAKNVIDSITKTSSAPEKPAGGFYRKPGGYSGKSAEERKDIRSQAVGHMTSRVIDLSQIEPGNLEATIEKVYNAFYKIVEKNGS